VASGDGFVEGSFLLAARRGAEFRYGVDLVRGLALALLRERGLLREAGVIPGGEQPASAPHKSRLRLNSNVVGVPRGPRFMKSTYSISVGRGKCFLVL